MRIKIWAGLTLVVFCSLPFFASAQAPIYISQVQITGGPGKTSNDFIELFNPNEQPVNLNGYRLVKRTAHATTDTLIKSWTVDTSIAAHAFYLWANSSFSDIAVVPDSATTVAISDDNGIALRASDDATNFVDSAAWGNVDNGFLIQSGVNPAAGQSLQRTSLYDAQSGFVASPSSPRNSQIVDVPPVEPEYPTPYETPYATPTDVIYETPYATPYSTPYAYPTPAISTTSNLIYINEIYPNPPGDDSGSEAVELINLDAMPVLLEGWVLDDGAGSPQPKSSALALHDVTLQPSQLYSIIIPKGKFALNNTGGDAAHLYNANQEVIDTVVYTDAALEGKSYQKINEQWVWDLPSLGESNRITPPPVVGVPSEPSSGDEGDDPQAPVEPEPDGRIVINEVLPSPAKGQDEFIELANLGEGDYLLKGWKLMVGSGAIDLPEVTISASGFWLVPTELIRAIANKGASIVLQNAKGNIIDQTTYVDAPVGQSWARAEDTIFAWTKIVTPGAVNVFSKEEAVGVAVAKTTTIKATVEKSAGSNTKLEQAIQKQLRAVQDTLNTLAQGVLQTAPAPAPTADSTSVVSPIAKAKSFWQKYLFVIIGVLAFLVFAAVYLKFQKSDTAEVV